MTQSLLAAFVLLAAMAAPVYADDSQISSGFQHLIDTAPDTVGVPLESEHAGDHDGSTVVRTTTGLLFWEPGILPSWTDGYNRLTLDEFGEVVKWAGDDLKPPVQPVLSIASVGGCGWPICGALGQRIYCIEGIESHHGVAMYNPTPVWNGEHAQGFLGFLGSTARGVGAAIGNRASEWQGAAYMLAHGRGNEFYGIRAHLC